MIYAVILFGLLMISMPIGTTLLITGMMFLLLTGIVDPFIAAQRVATGIDSFPLLAIPFFMLAAELMNVAGITDRMFRLAKCVVGSVPGGLAHVNVLASMLFAGMSGSAVADAAGLGRIEIKAMKDDGYDAEFAAAVTAASSTIGPIIPPSISFVIFGLTAGTSIGGLFLGGFIPGLAMGLLLMVLIHIISVRRHYGKGSPFKFSEFAVALKEAILPLMTPILIVGGIVGGIFTPTEAGAFAILYAFILGKFVYRKIGWKDIPDIIYTTAMSAGNVLFIIATSSLIGWILTMQQVPQNMAAIVVEWAPQPWQFLMLVNLLLLVLGCFMAAAPVIIMLIPVLLPVATIMGIHPIHLGVVMVLNLMVGLITPPVGLCLFVVSDIVQVPVMRVMRALLPFFIPLLVVLLLITFWSDMVMFLPRYLGFA